jgi:TonB family protein
MKKSLILTLLLLNVVLNGQKIYIDKFKAPVADSSVAMYYRIVEQTDTPGLFKENTFYITGEKESEYFFRKTAGKNIQEGKIVTWYKNGQLKSEIDLSNEQYSRIVTTYWNNGIIKRQDYFNKDILEKGTCFDSLGHKIRHFDYEIMPQYPGGDERLLSDISNSLNYPFQSAKQGIQGKVIVKFVVDEKGSTSNTSILVGVNPELNDEAMRVVKNLRKFIPASRDGEPVAVFYMIPINFRLR